MRNLDGAVGLQFQELNKSRHELGLAASGVDLDALVAAVGASDTLEAQLRSHWAYSGFQIRSMAHMRNLAEALIADIERVSDAATPRNRACESPVDDARRTR